MCGLGLRDDLRQEVTPEALKQFRVVLISLTKTKTKSATFFSITKMRRWRDDTDVIKH